MNHDGPAGAAQPERAVPPAPGGRQSFAVAALIVGIVALLVGWIPLIGAVVGAGAIALGVLAARRKRAPGKWVTGLTMGSLALLTSVAMTVAVIVVAPTLPRTPEATSVAQPPPPAPVAAPSPSEQVTQAPPAAEPVALKEFWTLRNDLRLPQFVGMNLAEARDEAKRVGIRLSEDDDRDNRLVWVASNWTVVSQNEPAGKDADEGAIVRVTVLKHDEVDRSQIADDTVDHHRDERIFTGRVTGYPRAENNDTAAVSVDGAELSVAMVSPLAPGCGSPMDAGLDAAIAELEKNLPIGQRVLVVMSNQRKNDAFLHVLSDTSNDPAVSPPGDSVNERLVRSGWWVPSLADGGVGLSGYADSAVAFTPYRVYFDEGTQGAAYTPLIEAAGNETATQYVGAVGECHRAAEAELEAERIRWAENERERERYRLELERRANEPVYCVDGDGDGVCFER